MPPPRPPARRSWRAAHASEEIIRTRTTPEFYQGLGAHWISPVAFVTMIGMATAILTEFRNESYADFSQPANRRAMEEALRASARRIRTRIPAPHRGRTNLDRRQARIAQSVEPERDRGRAPPSHGRAGQRAPWKPPMRYFPRWAAAPAEERVRMTLEVARILRHRKIEFDAWLVYEAGKTWVEAEADVSEAIDFCEYYAREMARLASPQPVVQLPGEADELIYIPLGVGVVIPPWNFPLAILVGMTVASLVTGNTAVLKPSSETPTIGAKFAEVLLEAGFPEFTFHPAHRQRRGGGRRAGGAPEDALHFLHRLARRGLAHQRTGRQDAARTDLDQARGGGNGRQGRHRRGCRCRPGEGRGRRAGIRVRLPGPEVLGLLAGHRRRQSVRRFPGEAGGECGSTAKLRTVCRRIKAA